MKDDFSRNGYTIFNIMDDRLIDDVVRDVRAIVNARDFKTNTKIYSYNDSPRIVESHKHSENCKLLAKHPAVVETLKLLYGKNPLPFSTINFMRSTQQPLHSDYVHFGTIPPLMLAGSWIALEDIDPDSGPLKIVPGSHLLEPYEFVKRRQDLPRDMSEIKANYTRYEEWVEKKVLEVGYDVITPALKKGDCIIWDANMLHGSPECRDNTLSRMSQVTHWSFDGVDRHYNPNFSIPSAGFFVEREVTYF
jgi:ectoine hydroxylase-related dioxygenase (phytanoyl-CoA dioxygenase family)